VALDAGYMAMADAGREADAVVVDELLQGERITELAEPLAWQRTMQILSIFTGEWTSQDIPFWARCGEPARWRGEIARGRMHLRSSCHGDVGEVTGGGRGRSGD
jgi:hypothetical protein